MATYHLSVKFGGKGQAANHADYIERKEKYRDRQDLEYSAHGNMPEWARDNPSHFWQAADQFERANGSTYRELEIALPRELTAEQRLELVQDFVRQEHRGVPPRLRWCERTQIYIGTFEEKFNAIYFIWICLCRHIKSR